MYSQILLKVHLKYKVTLKPVIVHYEVMNYSNGENLIWLPKCTLQNQNLS